MTFFRVAGCVLRGPAVPAIEGGMVGMVGMILTATRERGKSLYIYIRG
jgi:hypothetical protein